MYVSVLKACAGYQIHVTPVEMSSDRTPNSKLGYCFRHQEFG